jgi:hypothetical protein
VIKLSLKMIDVYPGQETKYVNIFKGVVGQSGCP